MPSWSCYTFIIRLSPFPFLFWMFPCFIVFFVLCRCWSRHLSVYNSRKRNFWRCSIGKPSRCCCCQAFILSVLVSSPFKCVQAVILFTLYGIMPWSTTRIPPIHNHRQVRVHVYYNKYVCWTQYGFHHFLSINRLICVVVCGVMCAFRSMELLPMPILVPELFEMVAAHSGEVA